MIKVLAGGVVALSALLYWQWRDWPPVPIAADAVEDAPTATGSVSGEAPDPLTELEPARDRRDFDVVAERPLFRPDRRPQKEGKEAQEPDAPSETMELDGFDLTAVLITGDKKRAWLKDPREQNVSEVREGDEVSGWTVSKIDAESVILERQGEPHTIDLIDFSKPAAPPIRPGRAARGAPARARPTKGRAAAPAPRNARTNRNAPTPPQTPERPERNARPPRG